MEINVLAEFEKGGIKYEWSTEDEIKILCPFHSDKSPSCCVNVKKQQFKCFVPDCNESGGVIKLLARIYGQPQAVILADLSKRYGINQDKTVPIDTVERYHQQIWKALPLVRALYDRGLDDTDIRKYRLGESEGRIQIPIANEAGAIVNLRRYLPGAPGKDKMRNLKGYGDARLFPIDQLKFDSIVICGGECKAIVAAKQLNPYGIGAICVTSGEGAWLPEFNLKIRGKRVYVCLDIDAAGKAAANRVCLQVRTVAAWVGNVLLPLDIDKYPKGDINDYVATEKGQLKPLLDTCAEYVPTSTKQEFSNDDIPEQLELAAAIHADKAAKRVCVPAMISTMDTSPYIVPKDVEIICDKNSKGGECALCPVYIEERNRFCINPESPAILEFVSTAKAGQLEVIKANVGVPKTCKVCSFQTHTHYNVEDARISPPLQITNTSAERTMQPALCIGDGLDLNESYNLTGRMFPHPKTQQATLLISNYAPTQDALSSYECADLSELGIFWPENDWSKENIAARLTHIYDDLAANVTRIFQRHDLHLAVDLTYHSPLFFPFDGKITKGWLETLIVGDSANGKSEVSCGADGNGGLRRHYSLGERVECKNATVAGLLGGCEKMGERWFVKWGIIPTNDMRLVVLEELKGTPVEVIAKLTDMRSSGIAEIPKIDRRKTRARCRLIAISNPRSNMKMRQYNFGIQAALELVGAPEDLRRFDFVLLVSDSEIDPKILNVLKVNRPRVEHTYTGELCRKLILWSWTRKANEVVFTDEATEIVLQEATKLCDTFTDQIPIVDRGSMRYKLARLSAAVAARTFSCSEDYKTLIIHPGHVEFMADTLKRVYGSPTFGYAEFTRASQLTQTMLDADIVKKAIKESPFPKDLIESLLAANKIELQDLQDWCAWERAEAQILLSVFVRKHALVREGKTAYRKTSAFITMLKEMLDAQDYPIRPAHIPTF